MPLSFLDFLSPKITLYYNGNNSHISHVGGLLSCLYLVLLALLLTNFLYEIFNPKFYTLYNYEEKLDELKYNQTLDYSGLNHFIQMYSHSNNGWFGDFDNKNILIYGIKETNKNIYIKNGNESIIDLYNTEHWLYDKCENIAEISKNLFSEISQTITNYTNTVCLRYYYNPSEQKYYEIGLQGYISPNLETNIITEKKYVYKIVVEKCFNNSIFTNKMHYICNNENEIIKYLNVYNDIFIYFSDNTFIPNKKVPFKKYFNSISSSIQKMSYVENNLIFSPMKLITNREFFKSNKEVLAFILNAYYHNDKIINEEYTIIGIFNFYFRNNLIIYKGAYIHFLESFGHFGGTAQLLFFIFQILNFINNRYIIHENTKNLFKINTGIDINYIEGGNEITFDKMRHLNSQNYRIKIFSNNNIFSNDEWNQKIMKQNKKKLKYSNYEHHVFGQPANRASRKNLGLFAPLNLNINSNRKKNNYDTKRSQTKYTNTFKQMGKQLTIKNKRKSYMSQGFLMKRNEKKDYSAFSKNQSINDNDINHEIISNNNMNDNNNSSFLLLKDIKDKEAKEGFFKYDSKNLGESNIIRKNKKKKTNLKKHQFDNIEGVTLKKIDPNIKGRHKSVNFGNQRDFLFSSNLLGIKNTFLGKNSSEYVNDSSKQVMAPNKSPFLLSTSKFQVEKNKFEDTISRPSIINNNDNNFNTVIYNNPNTETASYLKNIIQGKIKLIMNDNNKDYNLINFLERKTKFTEFFKFIIICFKRNDNKLDFLHKFRKKLLSEEHIYKVHINLYLLEKIFQIDEAYKFNANELYNNL